LLNWCEIDAGAIRWNIEQFRGRLDPASEFGAVVKANAYGHGMLEVAELARRAGVEWLCVNNVDEAAALRRAGHTAKLLVMGYVPLDRLSEVVELELRPVVYNLETLGRLDELARERGRRVPVHLKLETGTHRQGIAREDVEALARKVADSDGLALEGLTTHFANIEDSTDHAYAERQIERFGEVADLAQGVAGSPLMRHAACSAAT